MTGSAGSLGGATLLGTGDGLDWHLRGDRLRVDLPGDPPEDAPAHAVALDGVPNPRQNAR